MIIAIMYRLPSFFIITVHVGKACCCWWLLMSGVQMGYALQEFQVPAQERDRSFAGKFRSDIRLHIGNMGTTPKTGCPVNSNAPTRTGASQPSAILP